MNRQRAALAMGQTFAKCRFPSLGLGPVGMAARHDDETSLVCQLPCFEGVILYFNVGLKPYTQVKDEMARFMEDVASTASVAVPRRHTRSNTFHVRVAQRW
jgi:hypothetical protein